MNTIVTPSSFSKYKFPNNEEHILRDGLIGTLEFHAQENDIVYVQGDDGFGKSSLLAKFVERNADRCIALAVDPSSRYSYLEDSIIRDIYIQAKAFMNEDSPYHDESISIKDFTKKLGTLEYFLKKHQKKLFFVIDGLDQIPEDDDSYIQTLIKLLPVSSPFFTFIFSAKRRMLETVLKAKSVFSMSISLFSLEEAKQLLLDVADEDVQALLDYFAGTPEKLITIQRLVKNGVSVDEILTNKVDGIDTLFEQEWCRSQKLVSKYEDILSILAYSETSLPLVQIARELKTDIDSYTELNEIGFIEVHPNDLRYISLGFRKFAKKQFSDLRSKAIRHLINIMRDKPSEIESLSTLAGYYVELGETESVLNHLSNDNLELLLKESNSVNDLFRQIDLGIDSARMNENEMLRFSYLRSLLNGVRTSNLIKNELKYLLRNDDTKSALDLANGVFSNEERMQILCLLAADYKDKKKEIPENILIQIDSLFCEISPEHLGIEKTLDIAMDLFSVDSGKAMSLINKIDQLEAGGGNKSEYAFFRFTLEALRRKPDAFGEEVVDSNSLSDKRKKALNTLNFFKEGKPAEKILEGLSEIELPGEKIFILRNWIKAFPNQADNCLLINYLNDLAIKTTEYAINATFYSDICLCLPYLTGTDEAASVYKKILAQLDLIKAIGPTLDYIEVLIALVTYEKKHEIENLTHRHIYDAITEEGKDCSVVLASLSRLQGALAEDDPLLELIFDQKKLTLESVLENSAIQFDVLKEAFIIETKNDIHSAVSWAERLNTEYRKSEALACIVRVYCEEVAEENRISLDELCLFIRKIKAPEHKTKSISKLIKHLTTYEKISKNDFKRILKLSLRAKDSSTQCNFCSRLIDEYYRLDIGLPEQLSKLEQALEGAWQALEDDYQRIDIAFKIYNVLSKRKKELAESYVDKAKLLRKETEIDNDHVLTALTSSIDLQIRAFYFLVKTDAQSERELASIISDIERIPNEVIKVKLFARIVSAFQKRNKDSEARSVITNYIYPIIDNCREMNNSKYYLCSYYACPVLYRNKQTSIDSVLEPIKNSDVYFYEQIVGYCIQYLMDDCLVGDPFDPVKNHEYSIKYDDIECILHLISLMKLDDSTFHYIAKLARAVKTLKNKQKFSVPQFNSIKNKFSELSDQLFPKAGCIEHDGYVICAKALCLMLNEEKNESSWEVLVSRAETITNLSDRYYVIAKIADLMPTSMGKLKQVFFEKSYSGIETLSSYFDRLGRYEDLAETTKSFNKQFAKKCIESAFTVSKTDEKEGFSSKRLGLIDAAYGLDEAFPDTLATLYNDDPARQEIMRKNIRNKLKEHESDREFNPEKENIGEFSYTEKYIDLAWKFLGELNASNHQPIKTASFTHFLEGVSDYDYDGMYPLISYYIHVIGTRYRTKADCERYIRPIFNTLSSATSLFANIHSIESKHIYSSENESDVNKVVVDVGERDKALEFVKRWVDTISTDSILIVDPYFDVEDIEFIGEAISKDPDYSIRILTSLKQKKKIEADFGDDISEAITTYWTDHVSTGNLPDIKILFAGAVSKDLELPVHDRWWLADDSGVSVGTSIGGLGKRLSAVSLLDKDETAQVEQKIEGYLSEKQKVFEDKRVRYESITV